jgi:hypothetical protein
MMPIQDSSAGPAWKNGTWTGLSALSCWWRRADTRPSTSCSRVLARR